MNAILTVIGKDRVGIIAGVSQELAHLNVNILDVSQTIMNGYFTMMMRCDLSQITDGFSVIQQALENKGRELNVQISIQREEIFDAMHKL